MKDRQKAEQIATERLKLVAPLLEEGLDPSKARQIKARICEESGLSERTLRRYLERYRETGFSGLQPKSKGERTSTAIPERLLEQAILLRREVPTRSVAQIIEILEWEELAVAGQLKRSTLQEKLAQSGYSTRQMRLYSTSGTAARRFEQKSRNRLWHSDLKYGPYLPLGENGKKKQVYLVTFLDDATRFILHGEFYSTLDQVIVEDSFHQAVQKYGRPETVFFDNGKQYKTRWMQRACAKLGIRLLYARPYAPESTGKVERFNRVVDSFLKEAALERPQNLTELNKLFWIWLEECYQNRPHSALKDNLPPQAAFFGAKEPLKFLSPEEIATAFLHCEKRKVDKSGCISFQGDKYEVGLNFIGLKVEVTYDPADVSLLTIEYEGYKPWVAKKLVIGEHSGPRPELPERLLQKPAESSRLLKAASVQNEKRNTQKALAVTYRKFREGGGKDV